jgi:hypothetical protein
MKRTSYLTSSPVKKVGLFALLVILFFFSSWVKNVYHLTQLNFAAPYKAELARGLTTFPFFFLSPLTAWQDIGEEDCDVDRGAAPSREVWGGSRHG